MLYKKYHRNFVSQFKKGARYGYGSSSAWDRVEVAPYIFSREIHIISLSSSFVILVDSDGKLFKGIYVIQEIS